ncbi:MAG TPA: hypothetical protein K8W11_10310 [Anaerotruncus colihominis]|nr:hypothetical protein [Anaerotruncus colihominis]
MRGLTNKQDAVRRALAREFITMVFRGENNKLSGIKEYADRFGVGAGTVQGALADLKAAGAVSLKACGAQGTYIESADRSRLLEMCEYDIFIGLLPLDSSLCVKGMATGIFEAFTEYRLPIHILFARGSRNRAGILLREKCDFVVMSLCAYSYMHKNARDERRDLCSIGTISGYPSEHVFITKRDAPFSMAETQVAYDAFSYDQIAIMESLGKQHNRYGECLGVQLPELVRRGEVESALVERKSLGCADDFDVHPIEHLPPQMQRDLGESVVAVRGSDHNLSDLLSLVLTSGLVHQVQQEILDEKRIVTY